MTTENNSNLKWVTLSKYVDIDTGEIIQKEHAKAYYNVVGSKSRYIGNNIREFIHECKRKTQLKLEL